MIVEIAEGNGGSSVIWIKVALTLKLKHDENLHRARVYGTHQTVKNTPP